MPNSPTEQARREIEGQEFYELCQSYRHAPLSEQGYVSDRFQAIKKWIIAWHERHSHAPQPPTKQVSREEIESILQHHTEKCSDKISWGRYLVNDLLALFRPASLSQGSGERECPACHQEIKDDLHSV